MTRPIPRRDAGDVALGAWAVMLGAAMGVGFAAASAACVKPQPVPSYVEIDQRKQEIAMLWGQIREWRKDVGLRGVEPPMPQIVVMRGKPVSSAKLVCPADVSPTTTECRDVCALSDAICENAASICRIARQLPGDSWAEDKCASGKASCKQARERCCKCVGGEPTPADDSAGVLDDQAGGGVTDGLDGLDDSADGVADNVN